jgi:hypothetical protein
VRHAGDLPLAIKHQLAGGHAGRAWKGCRCKQLWLENRQTYTDSDLVSEYALMVHLAH